MASQLSLRSAQQYGSIFRRAALNAQCNTEVQLPEDPTTIAKSLGCKGLAMKQPADSKGVYGCRAVDLSAAWRSGIATHFAISRALLSYSASTTAVRYP